MPPGIQITKPFYIMLIAFNTTTFRSIRKTLQNVVSLAVDPPAMADESASRAHTASRIEACKTLPLQLAKNSQDTVSRMRLQICQAKRKTRGCLVVTRGTDFTLRLSTIVLQLERFRYVTESWAQRIP